MFSKIITLFTGMLLTLPAISQELFRLDFEDEFVPAGWVYSDKSEWGRVLGEEGGNYFRFHPNSWRDVLQTPPLDLEAGRYVLYFSWNEASTGNPDFCNIRIREGYGSWESIDRIGIGNGRTWEKDSAEIGNLPAGSYTLEFEYKTIGKFPAQYLNLDNIYLVRSDLITGLHEMLSGVELGVYPNPAHSQMNFLLKDPQNRRFDLRVLNTLGEIVVRQGIPENQTTGGVDISGLPAGPYILELIHREGKVWTRFMIQR
jgi:hypothetical protein